ncbi:MAG: hypothetical protein M0Q92_04905 [Methanoregula sp.]|jgi:hypothetical protein|nr:hypothetical protein [Methanoregula sp.]
MPSYYFSIEGTRTGERSDPATDRLVTLQYQKIDLTTGEPHDVLVIHRAWESSEQEIVTSFYNQFFRPGTSVTQFIPVGLNLDYAYEMLLALFRKYNLSPPTSYELYYQRPRFDLRPVVILLNNGRFAGASLDAFSLKKGEDRHMEKWIEKKEYGRIEHYVREEATRFQKVLQYLSKYKSRLGIIVKETPPSRKSPRTSTPSECPTPAPASPPRSPERPAPKAAATDKPAKRDRPAPAAKPQSRSLLPAPERTPAERKRSPAGRNQLAIHPSAKGAHMKKGSGKRRQA